MNFVPNETVPVQHIEKSASRSRDPIPAGASKIGRSDALRSDAEILAELVSRQSAYGPDAMRALGQLATTATAFVALLVSMAVVARETYWLSLLLGVPTAGLLVRLFIIQHDCGHRSFFESRWANDSLGRALSVLTLTPYGNWREGHAQHHAYNGNLDRRGRGDVDTLTVAEYEASAPIKKLGYRLYRNPFVMVLLGAPINFLLLQRLAIGRAWRDHGARRSILSLNLAIVVLFGFAMTMIGSVAVLSVYLPVMIIASWMGNWLFYVQHQFPDTYWERRADWSFHTAALDGSSYFKLPPILQWFSGNIGLHHVHHLCSRVPNYRLQAFLDSAPELHRIARRITLFQSVGCWRLVLWDEQRRRLVRFSDLKS